ncbi:unnamed protein product [Lactuca virosa]|uniref:Uncharacterized protein n=1 Tax=Lactuca virosa TaxID=75947 RepID=A0AAU9MNW9_9ASTR|nr:unnamed protein product [Lactuca virosa]
MGIYVPLPIVISPKIKGSFPSPSFVHPFHKITTMDSNLTIEVNHTGSFVPKPIVYFNPVKVVSNVDFRSMSFMEFISQETVMEWIEEEIVEDGSIDGNTDDDDDVDSELLDNELVEHGSDDKVIQIQPFDDHFIRRKFSRPLRVVDDKKDVKKDLHKYPVHDPNRKWDTMVPVLGMKLCDRYELKHLLSNYVVANGKSARM